MLHGSTEEKLDALVQMVQEMHDHEVLSHQGIGWRPVIQEVLVGTIWGSIVGYFLFRVMDHHFGAYHMPGAKKRKHK